MLKVNLPLLRAKIVERGTTQGMVAVKIGVDPSTFSRKMSTDGENFSIKEMHGMVESIPLTPEEAKEIFLFDNSHYCE